MMAYDERDTIFSRMELSFGSQRYESYYAAHPETKTADDIARSRLAASAAAATAAPKPVQPVHPAPRLAEQGGPILLVLN